jgi:hypothetical protein
MALRGIEYVRFPVGDVETDGVLAILGAGKVAILSGTWDKQGRIVILPNREAVDPATTPPKNKGDLGFDHQLDKLLANVDPDAPSVMLLFNNLEAVSNLRGALDSVEAAMKAQSGDG